MIDNYDSNATRRIQKLAYVSFVNAINFLRQRVRLAKYLKPHWEYWHNNSYRQTRIPIVTYMQVFCPRAIAQKMNSNYFKSVTTASVDKARLSLFASYVLYHSGLMSYSQAPREIKENSITLK